MENTSEMLVLVSSMLPNEEGVPQAQLLTQEQTMVVEAKFQECMTQIQRLMFDEDLADALAKIYIQRRVCGAQWSTMDIAYRCLTCGVHEHCVVCVTCFENGNHQDHAYFVIHDRGGCCDCGDVTAWKREGFCSNHGSEDIQIQSLEDELAICVEPVIDALFKCWKNKLLSTHIDGSEESDTYENVLTSAIVDMLLQFCEHGKNLQSLISMNLILSPGLLEILIQSERFLWADVVKKTHDMFLKLVRENDYFKLEFSKEFLKYYPIAIQKTIQHGNDLSFIEGFPMLCKFSLQIFKIPSITCCLVKEENLLEILFACLENIFLASAGRDRRGSRLEEIKWSNFYDITIHVIENIQVVIGHGTVLQHMFHNKRDLLRTWMMLLSFIQGMRSTGTLEEEISFAKCLLVSFNIADINSLLVGGGFDVFRTIRIDDESSSQEEIDEIDILGHAPEFSGLQVPDHVASLTYECLRAIENWYDPTCESTESRSIQHVSAMNSNFRILSLSEWPDIKDDFSSEEISVHYPLHHLLSEILRNAFISSAVASDGVFTHLLRDCHPYGYSGLIMEHPLRVRIFCAHYRVGIWDANDEIAMRSLNWYTEVCSLQGLESDLYLLQFCAAFAPPDCYIKRILERFGLSEYLSLNRQNSSKYEQALAREMLILIIQILQERRFCGLTPSQSLKRDVVCILAIKDRTYNKLLKSLPITLSEHHLKEVLDNVAIYCNPSNNNEVASHGYSKIIFKPEEEPE
ncbi:hypothetical protein ACFE04_016646 [Oxalis oulophora]